MTEFEMASLTTRMVARYSAGVAASQGAGAKYL